MTMKLRSSSSASASAEALNVASRCRNKERHTCSAAHTSGNTAIVVVIILGIGHEDILGRRVWHDASGQEDLDFVPWFTFGATIGGGDGGVVHGVSSCVVGDIVVWLLLDALGATAGPFKGGRG
jgi:hypothetical protein